MRSRGQRDFPIILTVQILVLWLTGKQLTLLFIPVFAISTPLYKRVT